MALLHFSDILINAGLDPAKVQLIRHAMNDKDFRACYPGFFSSAKFH